jgi:nicotinamidase-related amidase
MRTMYGKRVYETHEEILDSRHTALLVVDMQNDFVHPDGAYARFGDDIDASRAIIPTIKDLLRAARQHGIFVAYAQNTTLPNGLSDSGAWLYFKTRVRKGIDPTYTLNGTWGQRIIDELAPRDEELVVRKHRSDAFHGTSLAQSLRANGVEAVAVCGVTTNGCVEASARHAAFEDFYVAVIQDAVATSNERTHEASLSVMRSRHDVVPAEQVLAIWRETAESRTLARASA